MMQNISPDLMMKMLEVQKIKKKYMLFPDFSCMYRRMCVHARCIAW